MRTIDEDIAQQRADNDKALLDILVRAILDGISWSDTRPNSWLRRYGQLQLLAFESKEMQLKHGHLIDDYKEIKEQAIQLASDKNKALSRELRYLSY